MLLLGLVLIADAPGPAAVADCGSSRTWSPAASRRCGGFRGSRRGGSGSPPAPHNAPKVVRQLLEDLRAMTEAERGENG